MATQSNRRFILLMLACLICFIPSTSADFTCYSNTNIFNNTFFPQCEVVATGKYVLYWSVDRVTNEITFGVDAQASGWVGLGLSSTGGMKGADIAVFRRDGTQYVLEDRFSEDFVQPTLDPKQNLRLISYSQVTGRTWFIFKRSLSNCQDPIFDYKIDNLNHASTMVIWAFSSSNTFSSHTTSNRGLTEIDFFRSSSSSSTSSSTSNTQTFSVSISASIPTAQTTYTCKQFKFPNDTKYHIYDVDYNIQSDYIHHMVLFHCPVSSPSQIPDGNFECVSTPDDCKFALLWAPGVAKLSYPPQAGYPFGATSNYYFVLQMHYNNPSGLTGLSDPGSGFIFHYSSTLRTYDVGTFTTGTTPEYIQIPANTKYKEFVNECPIECTNKMPSDGIVALGNFLHMHQQGKRMYVEHVRNNRVIGYLGYSDRYDFSHQNFVKLNYTRIMPGDRLITHCIYNTEDRNTVTNGGENSQDEMCFAFMQYYPAMSMADCYDITTYANQHGYAGTYASCNGKGEQYHPVSYSPYTDECGYQPDVLFVNYTMGTLPQSFLTADTTSTTGGASSNSAIMTHSSNVGMLVITMLALAMMCFF